MKLKRSSLFFLLHFLPTITFCSLPTKLEHDVDQNEDKITRNEKMQYRRNSVQLLLNNLPNECFFSKKNNKIQKELKQIAISFYEKFLKHENLHIAKTMLAYFSSLYEKHGFDFFLRKNSFVKNGECQESNYKECEIESDFSDKIAQLNSNALKKYKNVILWLKRGIKNKKALSVSEMKDLNSYEFLNYIRKCLKEDSVYEFEIQEKKNKYEVFLLTPYSQELIRYRSALINYALMSFIIEKINRESLYDGFHAVLNIIKSFIETDITLLTFLYKEYVSSNFSSIKEAEAMYTSFLPYCDKTNLVDQSNLIYKKEIEDNEYEVIHSNTKEECICENKEGRIKFYWKINGKKNDNYYCLEDHLSLDAQKLIFGIFNFIRSLHSNITVNNENKKLKNQFANIKNNTDNGTNLMEENVNIDEKIDQLNSSFEHINSKYFVNPNEQLDEKESMKKNIEQFQVLEASCSDNKGFFFCIQGPENLKTANDFKILRAVYNSMSKKRNEATSDFLKCLSLIMIKQYYEKDSFNNQGIKNFFKKAGSIEEGINLQIKLKNI